MVRVAVTGAAGLIGQRLVERLATDDRIDGIVALDRRRPPDALVTPKMEFRDVDVRDPNVVGLLGDVDALVHLAFWMDPSRDEDAMRSVNIDGTRTVFAAAQRAGVRRLIYTSSVAVYGGHPDNDFPLTEKSPLRPNPDFNYGEQKYEVERWLWPWVEDHPEQVVTVLRPAIVAGARGDNFMTRQLEMPRLIGVKGYRPPWQFVHLEDICSAIELALHRDLPGPYNVACEGWLSHEEVVTIARKAPLELPEAVAFAVADRMWRLGLAEAPAGQLHHVMHPTVMSVERLLIAGWRPLFTNREALNEMVHAHRPYVNLGVVRARKRDLRLGAGVLSGLAGVALARKARERVGHRWGAGGG